MWPYFAAEFGNAGSRTHDFGLRAKRAVEGAREQVAAVVDAQPQEVTFTSGATESNNIAILGLAEHARTTGRTHIITTGIEHHAVLEPIDFLEQQGFRVTRISADETGRISAKHVVDALSDETGLVSIMHANNETGAVQPIPEITKALEDHPCYFHVDAAQSYGKESMALCNQRINLISISGHKIYGPKGIGALVARRSNMKRLPLKPLIFGGGQEQGLRPGTLPVPLIVGLGKAAEMAQRQHNERRGYCAGIQQEAISALSKIGGVLNGNPNHLLSNVVNFSFPGADSEAIMLSLKGIAAVSNGSACTSEKYTASHVLANMGLGAERTDSAIRFSWCHLTPKPDWSSIASAIKALL